MKILVKKLSFLYLLSVPIFATALAFIVGHVSYKFYVPFWLFNACLMILATRKLNEGSEKTLQKIAWYFITPWMLIAIFGGIGPPG